MEGKENVEKEDKIKTILNVFISLHPLSLLLFLHILFPHLLFQLKIMPIHLSTEIRRMADEEFKALVYEVMRQIFAVHAELGRLFHEKIYQREVAFRVPNAQREVAVDVRFEGFCKQYRLDLLVGGGAIFEMKAVESLSERHRRQLMHYLFLTGLPHGKLVNLRPERVEHEFINNTLTDSDRTSFQVADDDWQEIDTTRFREGLIAAIRDWGTGLDLGLYEEAALYLCGQPPDREAEAEIRMGSRCLGVQNVRLVAPNVAIRITALPSDRHANYQTHLSQFLEHTNLHAIQWVNITRPLVQFKTIRKRK
jgi:GxxExxY protein